MVKTKEKINKDSIEEMLDKKTTIEAKPEKKFIIEKKPETKVKEIKAEVVTEKPEEVDNEIKEELEDEFFEDDIGFIERRPLASFNYPFLRRAFSPGIRIQPIATNLEIDLDDIPVAKKEEDNVDQYKPSPEKNYSLNQKYELPGSGASYDSLAPKTITASQPPTLTPNFIGDTMNASRGFGNQNTSTQGYPGQEPNTRNYDSGLEQQTQAQQDKRRRDM